MLCDTHFTLSQHDEELMVTTTASLLNAANKDLKQHKITIEQLNRELDKSEDERLNAVARAWDIEKEKDRLAEQLSCLSIKYRDLQLEHSQVINKTPWWKFW